jgi:hypothetical protein|tara:strand:+ start:1203 stop:1487 length:285 start_codon:yes stop_codon:yes gene_type:complete
MALVKTKSEPDAALKEAVKIQAEPVDTNEPNGSQYVYGIVTGLTEPTEKSGKGKNAKEATPGGELIIGEKFTESQFRRLYSPFDHQDAKELREV